MLRGIKNSKGPKIVFNGDSAYLANLDRSNR